MFTQPPNQATTPDFFDLIETNPDAIDQSQHQSLIEDFGYHSGPVNFFYEVITWWDKHPEYLCSRYNHEYKELLSFFKDHNRIMLSGSSVLFLELKDKIKDASMDLDFFINDSVENRNILNILFNGGLYKELLISFTKETSLIPYKSEDPFGSDDVISRTSGSSYTSMKTDSDASMDTYRINSFNSNFNLIFLKSPEVIQESMVPKETPKEENWSIFREDSYRLNDILVKNSKIRKEITCYQKNTYQHMFFIKKNFDIEELKVYFDFRTGGVRLVQSAIDDLFLEMVDFFLEFIPNNKVEFYSEEVDKYNWGSEDIDKALKRTIKYLTNEKIKFTKKILGVNNTSGQHRNLLKLNPGKKVQETYIKLDNILSTLSFIIQDKNRDTEDYLKETYSVINKVLNEISIIISRFDKYKTRGFNIEVPDKYYLIIDSLYKVQHYSLIKDTNLKKIQMKILLAEPESTSIVKDNKNIEEYLKKNIK